MLMTPDLSEYKPPSAANTNGVDKRIVENRSEKVNIWRTVFCPRSGQLTIAQHFSAGEESINHSKPAKRATERVRSPTVREGRLRKRPSLTVGLLTHPWANFNRPLRGR